MQAAPAEPEVGQIEAQVRRWLLLAATLFAPAALLPDSIGWAIAEAVSTASAERIAGIAALTNALTLIP